MSQKHLSLKPHSVNHNTWWYEENGGIDIYTTAVNGEQVKLRIPWVSLRAALKRKDKK